MIRTLLLSLLCVGLSGCTTEPVQTTRTNRSTLQNTAHAQFVERRSQELERMGGPFKDPDVARLKAIEQANSLFGEPAPEYSTTRTWGNNRAQTQAEVKETLEKMDRESLRR